MLLPLIDMGGWVMVKLTVIDAVAPVGTVPVTVNV
jgi:hypothetical protein